MNSLGSNHRFSLWNMCTLLVTGCCHWARMTQGERPLTLRLVFLPTSTMRACTVMPLCSSQSYMRLRRMADTIMPIATPPKTSVNTLRIVATNHCSMKLPI